MNTRHWKETAKYLVLSLREPYWTAWRRWGWEEGVEGLGLKASAIIQAQVVGKKIKVVVKKYGSYEITPSKAFNDGFQHVFYGRNHERIYVVPRTSFTTLKRRVNV